MWGGRIILSVVFAVSTRQSAACSPFPGVPYGPFFAIYPGSPVAPVIKTSPAYPDILVGKLSLYSGEGYGPSSIVNVTIDLSTGGVTTGWPANDIPLSAPVQLSSNPTGSYELQKLSDTSVVLVGPDGGSISAELAIPPGLTIADPGERVFYFCSVEMNIAFIFYEARVDGCINSDDCVQDFYLSIDLATGSVLKTETFESPRGIYEFTPGKYNSLNKVFESPVNVVTLGALDSCGGTGYIRYFADGSVQPLGRFDPGYVEAIVDMDEFIAYRSYQNEKFTFEGTEATRYVESFSVQRINMVTTEIIETVMLNTDDLWSIAGLTPPFAVPAMTGAPTTLKPTTPVVTIEFQLPPMPVTQSGGIGAAPSSAPQDNTNVFGPGPVAAPTIMIIPFAPATVAPTFSPPTIADPTATPTEYPVQDPTDVPVAARVDIPTDFPVANPVQDPTEFPVASPVQDPTEFPVTTPMRDTTEAPFMTSSLTDSPTKDPTTVDGDTLQVLSQCVAHDTCSGLAGDCCPTIDSVLLTCCGQGQVELTCQGNPKCDALGLEGACCPTNNDDVYLDCCDVVPDECGDDSSSADSSSCVVYSALQYKADLEASSKRSANSESFSERLQLSAEAIGVTVASMVLIAM